MRSDRTFLGRVLGVVRAVLLANIWGYPSQDWPGRY
jgi:peptidoglycan biosynthesis protein MviN/MurJ (putative lipid II flippase)